MICWKNHHTKGCNEAGWRPGQEASLETRVRTWWFSEANVVHWRKYLWHYWDFSARGELCPLQSLVTTP